MYKYEIWHDGQCLMDRTGVAEDRIQEWKEDGCWNGETLEDFDVRVKEI